MGVLIKGMSKPRDCMLCFSYHNGYCGLKGERCTSSKGVDADCPITEVADRKTENSSEKPNNLSEKPTGSTISKMEQVGTTEDCSVVDAIRQAKACIERLATWSKTYEAMHMDTERKTEPQTEDAYAYDEDDWYDKAEREGE